MLINFLVRTLQCTETQILHLDFEHMNTNNPQK